mmetsp:Transcript_33655/g.85205  ORF Transcript_33655/g.85205 Transcript_33655/m.85205 type:complete len:611 (-) Transcript_33655:1309-3141(-)
MRVTPWLGPQLLQQRPQALQRQRASRVDGQVVICAPDVRRVGQVQLGRARCGAGARLCEQVRLEDGAAREQPPLALGQHAPLVAQLCHRRLRRAHLQNDWLLGHGQRLQGRTRVLVQRLQRCHQVWPRLHPCRERGCLGAHVLEVKGKGHEQAVALQVSRPLFERSVALLQLGAQELVRGARLAILHDGHAQVDEVRGLVHNVVQRLLGRLTLLQQAHHAPHAHVAATRQRLLLLHLLRVQVPDLGLLLVVLVAELAVALVVGARRHARRDVAGQAARVVRVVQQRGHRACSLQRPLRVRVHQGGNDHAGRRAPDAHLAVEDDRVLQAPLHDGLQDAVKVLQRGCCAVRDGHAAVLYRKALRGQAGVHLSGRLYRVRVVNLLPRVVQLSKVAVLERLVSHQDLAAMAQRFCQHVLLQPLLHGLQPRRVDARVLHHVLQGAHLLPQHKGAAVDVDDRLLAHVDPQRVAALDHGGRRGARDGLEHTHDTIHCGHAHTIDGGARDTSEVGRALDDLRDLGGAHAREVVLLENAERAQHRACALRHHILFVLALHGAAVAGRRAASARLVLGGAAACALVQLQRCHGVAAQQAHEDAAQLSARSHPLGEGLVCW